MICGSAIITEWDLLLDEPSLYVSDFLLASVMCRLSGGNRTHINIYIRHANHCFASYSEPVQTCWDVVQPKSLSDCGSGNKGITGGFGMETNILHCCNS